MSYIIENNTFIAEISDHVKSGTEVLYSYQSTEEKINANFDRLLVNARIAKISNAKKWMKEADIDHSAAVLVNDYFTDEYLVFTA